MLQLSAIFVIVTIIIRQLKLGIGKACLLEVLDDIFKLHSRASVPTKGRATESITRGRTAGGDIPEGRALKGKLDRPFRGYDEFRHSGKTRQKRSDALGKSLLCGDGVAGRYIIQ